MAKIGNYLMKSFDIVFNPLSDQLVGIIELEMKTDPISLKNTEEQIQSLYDLKTRYLNLSQKKQSSLKSPKKKLRKKVGAILEYVEQKIEKIAFKCNNVSKSIYYDTSNLINETIIFMDGFRKNGLSTYCKMERFAKYYSETMASNKDYLKLNGKMKRLIAYKDHHLNQTNRSVSLMEKLEMINYSDSKISYSNDSDFDKVLYIFIKSNGLKPSLRITIHNTIRDKQFDIESAKILIQEISVFEPISSTNHRDIIMCSISRIVFEKVYTKTWTEIRNISENCLIEICRNYLKNTPKDLDFSKLIIKNEDMELPVDRIIEKSMNLQEAVNHLRCIYFYTSPIDISYCAYCAIKKIEGYVSEIKPVEKKTMLCFDDLFTVFLPLLCNSIETGNEFIKKSLEMERNQLSSHLEYSKLILTSALAFLNKSKTENNMKSDGNEQQFLH